MTVGPPKTKDLVTVIITTSATPSAPSTELIATVLESFRNHCASLRDCRVIVVFDGYDQIVARARLKKGQVTPEQAQNFDLYKKNVKSLILNQYNHQDEGEATFLCTEAEAEYGSPGFAQNAVSYVITQTRDKKVSFIESTRRFGFGLAVRSALRITETPYVWVQQHDWTLVSDFPIDHVLQIMRDSEHVPEVPIKYICLPAVRMLSYAESEDVMRFPLLRDLTTLLKRDFSPATRPDVKIPLTPFFFWHDKPHIASTSHYLASVFPTRLSMLRGDFIEDKVGQRARGQMKEGFVSVLNLLPCTRFLSQVLWDTLRL